MKQELSENSKTLSSFILLTEFKIKMQRNKQTYAEQRDADVSNFCNWTFELKSLKKILFTFVVVIEESA